MTPDQLQSLGLAALRQLARQKGLRGAWVLPEDALRAALAAFVASAPPEAEDDDAEDPPHGASLAALPPALQTETMARLLETQGKRPAAAALRAGLRQRTPPPIPKSADTPALHGSDAQLGLHGSDTQLGLHGSDAQLGLHGNDTQLRLHWRLPKAGPTTDAPGPAEQGTRWQIELWIWRARGSRVTKRIAVEAAEGDHGLERPPDAAYAAAVLSRRDPGGATHPVARTALWHAEDLGHPATPSAGAGAGAWAGAEVGAGAEAGAGAGADERAAAAPEGAEPLLHAPADP